jgi:hypothetical protein
MHLAVVERWAMMNVRVGRVSALVTVSAAVLMVCTVPVVAAASGAPALTPGSPYTVWAYGAVRSVSFHGNAGLLWTYQGNATYGYSVVLSQTNLTTEAFELAVNRTMGAALAVEYCSPNCKSPTETATISYRGWEATDEWANFTTAGTVDESGTAVPAIALNNSHSTVAGSLLDRAVGPHNRYFESINASSTASVSFATPLGLLPDTLTPGVQWNDTSSFSASGDYALDYFYSHTGPLNGTQTIGPLTIGGAVNATGTVSVAGSVGTANVNLGGTSFQNVSLAVIGPFSVREGFILVPAQVDLFGGSSESPLGYAVGTSSVQQTSIYARPFIDGHFGVGGSEWLYSSAALNPQVSVSGSSEAGVGQLTPGYDQIAPGSGSVGSTPVQGVPMSVSQAKGVQDCLVTGASCPSAPGLPRHFAGLVVVLAVAVVAVLIAAVVVQRRRMPPPTRSNSGLYPPVVTVPGRAPPLTAGQNPPPPPPPEEDPLSHLW